MALPYEFVIVFCLAPLSLNSLRGGALFILVTAVTHTPPHLALQCWVWHSSGMDALITERVLIELYWMPSCLRC